MNKAMLNDRLTKLIGEYATAAMATRQVARRLGDLLPARLAELKREHTGAVRGGDAVRRALTDARYLAALEELGDVSGQATLNRIQFETHTMLFMARQTLRTQRL